MLLKESADKGLNELSFGPNTDHRVLSFSHALNSADKQRKFAISLDIDSKSRTIYQDGETYREDSSVHKVDLTYQRGIDDNSGKLSALGALDQDANYMPLEVVSFEDHPLAGTPVVTWARMMQYAPPYRAIGVYEIHRELVDKGEALTVQAFNEKLGGGRERTRSLVEIFKEHNYQVEKLLHTDFSPGTLERYKTALKHVQSFMKWKFNVDDIDINKLSYQFATDYEFWLKAELKCSHNTAVKYIGNLKKIINICIKNGWLDRDPFLGGR